VTLTTAHVEDLARDACSAFRADLAELAAASGPGTAPPAPRSAPDRDPAGHWLRLVTALERAAQLAPRRRPAHFRRAAATWADAADYLDEPRYAGAAARLARWRSADPTLPLLRALLWTVEQPEAAGYTRLALAGYSALARLVPPDERRAGYVLAQSARALRTLGDLDGARERYETSERIAARHRDRWLRVRSAIGLGATHHQHGNHPAARAVFQRVLTRGSPDPRFTAAAHHGLLLSATASGANDEALAHAWYLLRASRDGHVPRVDAWLLMAEVCARLSRYRAAAHLAHAALRHATRPDDIAVALEILVEVATDTGDLQTGRQHADALRGRVGSGASAYDDVRSLLALAAFEHACGEQHGAQHDLGRARARAAALGLHELVFRADALASGWEARAAPAATPRPPAPRLTPRAARIVQHAGAWSCAADDGGRPVQGARAGRVASGAAP
jgi:tetratricopeptide (TPR) repeat protein